MFNIQSMVASLPAVFVAIAFHEYAHGKAADLLGDPTPRYQGRLTLNPMAHLDILGMLLFIIVGFGWAKPVQVNPYNLRGNRRQAMMLVALAGPMMNIAIAFVSALILLSGVAQRIPFGVELLYPMVHLNVVLAAFNLLPIPPLDGSKILSGLLPGSQAAVLDSLEHYGPLLLMLLIVSGFTGVLLGPVIKVIYQVIIQLARLLIGG